MNQNEQMRDRPDPARDCPHGRQKGKCPECDVLELEATVKAQARLIKALEDTKGYLLTQHAKWAEATRTLESEREANRMLTEELEQAKQALASEGREPDVPYSTIELAKVILTYCGCTTENENLVQRVANRIHSAQSQPAEPVAQPYAHIYEFDSAVFGTHRSFSPSQWNGMKPTRTVAVYTHPAQPVQPAGAQEPVHFRAVLCREQQDQAIGVVPKVVGFVDKKAAEQFILEKRDFQGWRYNLEPLYTEAPAVAVDEQFAVLIKKANDQAEHFEREWYLRGDELEALEQVNAQLLEALKELMYARTDKAEGMADAAIARAALLQAREAGL